MEPHAALQQELLDRERSYWNAVKAKDSQVAARLSDDPCMVVGAQGVGEMSRSALATMFDHATYELNEFNFDKVHVRRLSNDIAVIAYKVNEDLTVDGKKVELEAFDSSVWIKRDGEWVCVLHTESLAGDPFSRDRSATARSSSPP